MYNVGIYLRLSKEDERLGESGSIKSQRAILMDYINKNNLNFIAEYVDDGVSGTTFDRIGFKKMIRDIENNKINMIITKDTSRLGRDHIEFGYYVEKYFPENNVRYVAVVDNIDTFFNNNDMLLFKSAYNDMYVKDISNKIRASLNIKKKNGEFVGAYPPYGYKKDIFNKHKLILDIEEAKIVKRIFNLFINGNSMTSIANILTSEKVLIPSINKGMNRGVKSNLFGIWNVRTISDILTNPTYIGNLTQGRNKKINYKSKKRIHTKKENWIITFNTCPKIIDEDVFNLVNSIISNNKNKYKKNCDLLLKGMIYCCECNHKIGFRKSGNYIYGACNYYLKYRTYNVCTPHNIKYNIIEKLVLNEVKKILSSMNYSSLYKMLIDIKNEKFIKSNKDKYKSILKELELIDIKMDKLYDDRLTNVINKEMYIKNNKKLLVEKQNLLNIKEKIINNNDSLVDINKIFNKFLDEIINDKNFICSLIKKITYSENKEINIFFNISCCNS